MNVAFGVSQCVDRYRTVLTCPLLLIRVNSLFLQESPWDCYISYCWMWLLFVVSVPLPIRTLLAPNEPEQFVYWLQKEDSWAEHL